MKINRALSQAEIEKRQMQKDLLDSQEMAATLFEQNQQLNNSLLDTQELLASIVEGGVV